MNFWEFLDQNMCWIAIGAIALVVVIGEYWGRNSS